MKLGEPVLNKPTTNSKIGFMKSVLLCVLMIVSSLTNFAYSEMKTNSLDDMGVRASPTSVEVDVYRKDIGTSFSSCHIHMVIGESH